MTTNTNKAALDKLVKDGVITVDANGTVKLTAMAWNNMMTPTVTTTL